MPSGPDVFRALLASRRALEGVQSKPARRVLKYIDRWLRSVAALARKRMAGAEPEFNAEMMWKALVKKWRGEKGAARRTGSIASRYYRKLAMVLAGPFGKPVLEAVVDQPFLKRAMDIMTGLLKPGFYTKFTAAALLVLLLLFATGRR